MNKHGQVKHTIWGQMIKTNPKILEETMKKEEAGKPRLTRTKEINKTISLGLGVGPDVGCGLSNQQSPSPGSDHS
jgi:hypothetical protein